MARSVEPVNVRGLQWLQPAIAISLLVAVFVGATAAPAAAHAQLVASDPIAGASLTVSPSRVTLTFDESVEVAFGAVALLDSQGHQIGVGRAAHPPSASDQITAAIPTVGVGGYVVTWRVTSADGHPVQGAFTFRVGDGRVVDPALVQRALENSKASVGVRAAATAARLAGFSAFAVLVGLVASVLFNVISSDVVGRAGWFRRLVGLAAVVAVVGTIASLMIQVPLSTGGRWTEAFHVVPVGDVVSTRSGRALAIRAGGLVVVAIGLLRPARLVGAAGLAIATGAGIFIGHGATGRWPTLALVVTGGHLLAMAIWVGGLVALAVVARTDSATFVATAGRFSPVAFWAVVALIVTGVINGVRQVGSFDSLVHTSYGRLLFAKSGVVAVMVAFGALSRRSARNAPNDERDETTLRASVRMEASLAGAALVVTSLLVAAVPAEAARARPFAATIVQGSRLADVLVEPAIHGTGNVVHLTLSSSAGSLERVTDITARLTPSSADTGPIAVPLIVSGPNHWVSNPIELPFAGRYSFEAIANYPGVAAGSLVTVRFSTTVPVS